MAQRTDRTNKHRRRAKHRAAARQSLNTALQIFERLPAPLWADRVRDELRRIGGRTSTQGLTNTEQRVADLAVRGLSNQQIAAELFVTGKTVEAHLSRIYHKLGVRSRTELASRYHPA